MTRQSALSVTNSDAGDVSINFPRPLSPDFATQPIEPRWDQVEVLSIWRNAHDPIYLRYSHTDVLESEICPTQATRSKALTY